MCQKPKIMTHLKTENGVTSELSLEQIGGIAKEIMAHLEGLNKPSIESVLKWVQTSLEDGYFLSNPNLALNV